MKHACRQATMLASESLDRPLTLWERLKLKLHLSMCRNCSNCHDSMQLLHRVQTMMREQESERTRLSDQQRDALRQALAQSIKAANHPQE